MPQQLHNDQRATLLIPDVTMNGAQYLHEPIGDFGVWNGQFETPEGSGSPAGWPEGWEITLYDPDSTVTRVTGGVAGKWCMKGGHPGPGAQRGGYIHTNRYFMVDENRDYYISAAFKGSSVNSQVYLGARCYDANKVLLADTYPVSGLRPGVNWVRYQRRIGPNGDSAWPAGTRYARPIAILQYDNTLINDYAYVDDIQFQQQKMTYSPLIHLVNYRTYVGSTQNFTLQAFTLYNGSAITLTLEEPGYIWFWYTFYTLNQTAARTVSIYVRPYLDAGAHNPVIFVCSPGINYTMPVAIFGRTPALAAGAHTVDLRVNVVNAGDTVQCDNLLVMGFYTREN